MKGWTTQRASGQLNSSLCGCIFTACIPTWRPTWWRLGFQRACIVHSSQGHRTGAASYDQAVRSDQLSPSLGTANHEADSQSANESVSVRSEKEAPTEESLLHMHEQKRKGFPAFFRASTWHAETQACCSRHIRFQLTTLHEGHSRM